MEKVTEKQIKEIESAITYVGLNQQKKTSEIFDILESVSASNISEHEKVKLLNKTMVAYAEMKHNQLIKKELRKNRDDLKRQFVEQNDDFLNKANAVHVKTGELLIVEEDLEKHCKVKRSNHITNTLKKKDIKMLE